MGDQDIGLTWHSGFSVNKKQINKQNQLYCHVINVINACRLLTNKHELDTFITLVSEEWKGLDILQVLSTLHYLKI